MPSGRRFGSIGLRGLETVKRLLLVESVDGYQVHCRIILGQFLQFGAEPAEREQQKMLVHGAQIHCFFLQRA